MSIQTCEWAENCDGIWHTSCKDSFYFDDGKPSENGVKFCCFCGSPLVEIPYVFGLEESN